MDTQCREIRLLFDRFLDGDLRGKEKFRLKRHLRKCQACRYELEKEQGIAEMLATLPEFQCPEEVVARIKSATLGRGGNESLISKIKFSGWLYGWRPAVVGIAVSIFLLLLVFHPLINRKEPLSVSYSQVDVRKAREQAKWSLIYVSQTINKTEKGVVEQVLMNYLPKTMRNSIKYAIPILRGGG